MIYETQKLLNSDSEILNKIGWILYDRKDENSGLTYEELNRLVKILLDGFEKEMQDSYNEGYEDGLCDG